ncbi:aminotransferase class V-fold PLP-dependent enzyme [Natronolimnobius sp. AArcel1]|uniref:aminotransferase class V-fold PLP-dependent enzyme n=1 Tax=Natronolimnobius sp. AArcel1 TaxID=1679093 RepID=UPI0013EB52B2|nr:aminotransferase class V-fold PLP-dependent enzyme [Natronolimnobius sp. AArcel1]NGM70617.1 aminotransferase class V-fold PLP-dependent enzyme [Natronolimnobius sp. AArcel1]
MTDSQTIYDELGVPPVVNAASTKTRIGGSLIRPEAVEAMSRAAESFVRISDLQARASELISDVTGSEAGYVASGAAACLTLGTAACMAGDDLGAMNRLPHTGDDVPNEVIMPRAHRNGYDHAIRMAGAEIVDVGNNDNHLGTGSKNTELWEIEDAINENTAAVGYMQKSYSQPELEDVCEVAHAYDVPVIVDAAAELPPTDNLTRFIDEGADLVVFSGGKAIRGPQTTGILAGKQELIESAALQHLDMHVAEEVWEPPTDLIDLEKYAGVPRQGIGRPLKSGKEELAGLIRALELFIEEDHDARMREWSDRTELMAESLREEPGLSITVTEGEKTAVAPEVFARIDPDAAGIDAETLVGELRRENPRVFVGPDHLHESAFTANPMCLTDEEAEYVVERVRSYLD